MIEKYLRQTIDEFNPYHEFKRMTYEDGVLLIAAMKFYQLTNDSYYFNFLKRYLEAHIDESGVIVNYHPEEYNIDNILAGNVLFFMYDLTKDKRYKLAIESLRGQLKTHPRTDSKSFWHKLRYPNQIWLDGLYMGQIFYLRYGYETEDEYIADDVMNQIENVRKYLFDEKKRLYFHAYDEKKIMQWANRETGRSPNVWSRAVGWFAMALVEIYDIFLFKDNTKAKRVAALLSELLEGMLPYRDKTYSMWYQLVEFPDLAGNYLETSGTAMLAFSMLKGARLKMLDPKFQKIGIETLKGIENKYLREEDGKLILGGTCQVAGLDNERRDGSIYYYLSEKVVENEIKGLAPYFYCYSELLRIKK